jgi:hypothetical protein
MRKIRVMGKMMRITDDDEEEEEEEEEVMEEKKMEEKEEEDMVGNNFLLIFVVVAYCSRAVTKSQIRTTKDGRNPLAFYCTTENSCYGSQYSLLYLEL